jgi:hypothetical protein
MDYTAGGSKIETRYHYTYNEDKWGGLNNANLKNVDAKTTSNFSDKEPIDEEAGPGRGFTFFYNLDWGALDDYSTQQNW